MKNNYALEEKLTKPNSNDFFGLQNIQVFYRTAAYIKFLIITLPYKSTILLSLYFS